MGGGHIASPLSVRPYIRTDVHTYVPYNKLPETCMFRIDGCH